jgi:two-component system, chemotaxis family, sensor kinase CheA
MEIPDSIVHQFRAVAQERLERVEAAWTTVCAKLDDEAAAILHREVHTLKGEARVVGFTDVDLVCHRLEDLLEVARNSGYAVDEELDLVVNMALRFIAMLVRKKVGSQLAGIDLPGFLRQIDQVLADARGETTGRTRISSTSHRARGSSGTMNALRSRLDAVAVDAFLEYAAAIGNRRSRLRASWHALRDMVGIHRAMFGAGQLRMLERAARELAQQLGKQVDMSIQVESAEVTTAALAVLHTAALHALRNAIDHGIETPDARRAAGKPPRGAVSIRGAATATTFELAISDDGAGIQFDRVRARARELGIYTPEDDDDERWVDVLCHPGLSTRRDPNEVSGRGIGLDAVRAAAADVKGSLSLASTRGAGTTWTISIPMIPLAVAGTLVRPPNMPVPVIVDASWQVREAPAPSATVVDLAWQLGFTTERRSSASVWFARDTHVVGMVCEDLPSRVVVRRLVPTHASHFAEVVTIDGVDALLVRLERLLTLHTLG